MPVRIMPNPRSISTVSFFVRFPHALQGRRWPLVLNSPRDIPSRTDESTDRSSRILRYLHNLVRQHHPVMFVLRPNCPLRLWKCGVGERSDRYADVVSGHLTLPIYSASADWAEMRGYRVTAFAFPAKFCRSAAGLDDVCTAVECSDTEYAASAVLTCEAMAT
jgi:hypothetical protein